MDTYRLSSTSTVPFENPATYFCRSQLGASSRRATADKLPIPPEATLKIREIRAAPVDLTPRPTTVPRVPRQAADGFVSPMRRYNEYRRAAGKAPLKVRPAGGAPGDRTHRDRFPQHPAPALRMLRSPMLVA